MNKNEYEIEKWIGGKADSSIKVCKRAYNLYAEYIKEKEGRKPTAKQLIDEIEGDRKKPARKRGEIEDRLKSWAKWLRTEYKSPKTGEPASENTVITYIGIIMGFYRANGFRITFTERFSDLFSRRAKYPKKLIIKEDVEKMIDECKTLRDKAIIFWLYEGGFDVSTLCSLNYGDVKDQLNEDFMTLKAYRTKEKWEYITHVGEFGTGALRAYLKYREKRGEVFYDDTPLFVKGWTKKPVKQKGMNEDEYRKLFDEKRRIEPRQIDFLVLDLALRTGLVKKVPKNHQSPVRPHAFRMSFKTLLESAMEKTTEPYVEGWLGHKVKWGGVYWKPNELMSLEKYKSTYYKGLAIRQTKAVTQQLEQKLSKQEERINALWIQNSKLESKVTQMEQITRPFGSMDLRTAVLLKGLLLKAKGDRRNIDSMLVALDEMISEAKPIIVSETR